MHLPANGDVASVLLFGGVILLSQVGIVHIEARRRRTYGGAWDDFAQRTSIVPFVALARGRARLSLAALGPWRLALGLGVYVVVLFAHGPIFGKDPLLVLE